jgi:hypothetical protein
LLQEIVPLRDSALKKLYALALLLAIPVGASAATSIPANATVYISPMDGFESDLQAAFLKKHVPLEMIADKDKAAYIVSGKNDDQKAGWAKTIFFSPAPAEHASITITDAKSGAIVFAYSVDKSAARHGPQSAAEACAKHLREAMESK